MIKSFINLFFPKSCSGCKSYLQTNEQIICTNCRHEIPLTDHHKIANNEAFMKFYGKINIEFASAMMQFHKTGVVQDMIHDLKYRGNQKVGTFIGNWYAEDLKKVIKIKDVDTIIPVPLHKKRLKKRGYNQVTTFGNALSNQLNIDFDETILRRSIYSDTQTKKSLINRSNVFENVFEVYFDESHHDKHFLLIDDVITTGSTLESCCRALLKIPNARISVVCMAMSSQI